MPWLLTFWGAPAGDAIARPRQKKVHDQFMNFSNLSAGGRPLRKLRDVDGAAEGGKVTLGQD